MEFVESLAHDIKLAWRTFVREKGWTAVAIVTLALGIGANSALFTIINAVLLRPLPYPQADRVISISESDKGVDREVVASPTLAEWQRSAKSLAAIAATTPTNAIVKFGEEPRVVSGQRVTASFFTVVGVQPAHGRAISAEEDRPAGPQVVVVSDHLWRTAFSADSGLLGKPLLLDGVPATIIGIMPAGFTGSRGVQYWVPLRMNDHPAPGVTFYYFAIGRLRPGVSIAAARTELSAINRALDSQRPAAMRGRSTTVMTVHERRFGDSRPALLILLGAVGVLLLIACANVSNLLLARAARRQREFAVRIALGASRSRLIRYLLSESLLLALMGGVLGLAIPFTAVGYFVRLSPGSVSNVEGIHVDGVVLAFTLLVSVITGVVFGLIPAIDAGRADVNQALSAGSTRGTSTPRQNRLRRALVVVELGTALLLLTGAGLLTRSLANVTALDPGFRPERLLAAEISLSRTRYQEAAIAPFYNQLLERVRALPGVQSAALGDGSPMGGTRFSVSIKDKNGKDSPQLWISAVSPEYFATAGTRLVAGRSFTAADRVGAPKVAMINEATARVMFPGVDPIGQVLPIGEDTVAVVGVVHSFFGQALDEPSKPAVFRPLAQDGMSWWQTVVVRTAGSPEALESPIREAVRAIDPDQPAPKFFTMEQALADRAAPRRFNSLLLGIFAGLAAMLAAIGLYGVMSYLVADRTREIGIRVALGADRNGVIGLVVRQGMSLAGLGILMGLAASVASVRVLRAMLFQVSIYDPWTFGGGAALLALVAAFACFVPALRATRVDPITALRAE